jgi:Xaa-Pro aminopeptidase
MFKLSETDGTTEIRAEQNELDEILRSSVPGLVSKTRQKSTTNDNSDSKQGNSGTGHKILIEPSVFNMSILLPPSLSFIQRLKEIVPVDSDIAMSTLTSFLDDFMVNVFLPQLDETVTDLCTLSYITPDSFTEDSQWLAVSPRPVFKVSSQLPNALELLLTLNTRERLNSCLLSASSVKCCLVSLTTKHLHSY